jgi:hypothetical protein
VRWLLSRCVVVGAKEGSNIHGIGNKKARRCLAGGAEPKIVHGSTNARDQLPRQCENCEYTDEGCWAPLNISSEGVKSVSQIMMTCSTLSLTPTLYITICHILP